MKVRKLLTAPIDPAFLRVNGRFPDQSLFLKKLTIPVTMTVTSLIKENRIFFFCFLLFVLVSLVILIAFSKADGFYILNPYHSRLLDDFFIFYANAGDGLFCVAVGLLLFLIRKRFLGLMVLVSYAISGILAQVLKHFIREARPAVFLTGKPYRYFIQNVTLHNYQAFPSTHTASAFAMEAVLSLLRLIKSTPSYLLRRRSW